MSCPIVVMIPTAGRAELLERTLDSLAAAKLPSNYLKTIVVENGPKGLSEDIVRNSNKKLKAHYQYVERSGKSNALNIAIEPLADDCLIYMTDDDVRFSPDVLERYSVACKDRGVGMFFGGPTGVDYEKSPPAWIVPHLPLDAKDFTEEDFHRGNPPMVFLGYNWAAFAGDLRRVGGFNTGFGPGGTSGAIGQESEMQQRLLRHGVEPRFVVDAFVWHSCPVKRCSPDYFVHRHYRYGILDAKLSGKPSNPFGIPWFHLRKMIRSWLRYAKSRWNGSEERRFLAKRAFYFRMGQVRGAWQASRDSNRSISPMPKSEVIASD